MLKSISFYRGFHQFLVYFTLFGHSLLIQNVSSVFHFSAPQILEESFLMSLVQVKEPQLLELFFT